MPTIFRKGWNWCRRFRHRKGYGVHSPSDFYLITSVIYEQAAYNAYRPLHELRQAIGNDKPCYREKVDKLLLRLANHLQPASILEIGTGNGIDTCYLANGKRCPLLSLSDTEETDAPGSPVLSSYPMVRQRHGNLSALLQKETAKGTLPPLIHLGHTDHYRECFDQILPHVSADTCIIVGTPYATHRKQTWWKEIIQDPRTGVTFDLYDVGLVFFDKKRVKEHRIVNFF